MSDEFDEAFLLAHLLETDIRSPFYTHFPDTGPLRRELYAKHLEFFKAGASYPQRLFLAGNRIGKSDTGAYEVACHLTGLYPPWWEGRRFDGPIECWACGTTSETLRDIIQTKLFGIIDPDTGSTSGGGFVPSHMIVTATCRPHGLPGSLETVWVKHISGGRSKVQLKMYEQGRKSFEGTAKDVCWCDEEPPEDVYTEMLYRTLTRKGITLVTFTPLQGMSSVVSGFLTPANPDAMKFKHVTTAGWDDVPHLDAETKAGLLATTPPFQREARTKGIPQLGSGAIYAISESEIMVPDFPVPKHYRRAFGMDAGGGRQATAVAWGAIDPASNTLYIYAIHKRESPELAVHIAAIRARGAWIPGVGDAAALITTAHDAEQLLRAYQRAGIDLELPDKAVEAGIQAVWEMMSEGRLKVFQSCNAWFDEFRLYHRDEKGKIMKLKDHLMDASRYLVRSGLKRAKLEPVKKAPVSDIRPSGDGGHEWMA